MLFTVKIDDFIKFPLKGKWSLSKESYLVELLYDQCLWGTSPPPRRVLCPRSPHSIIYWAWLHLLLFRQKLLLYQEQQVPEHQRAHAAGVGRRHPSSSILIHWLSQTEPLPILTVHSLSTQTGYRSAGPCSKQNSQHLQDVALFPHSAPGQKGWQKVLQKPNIQKEKKHHPRHGHTWKKPSLKYILKRKGTLHLKHS